MPESQDRENKTMKRRAFLAGGLLLMGGGGALAIKNVVDQKDFESSGSQKYETSTGDENGQYAKHTEIPTNPQTIGASSTAESPTAAVQDPAYLANPAYTENFESDAYGEPTNGQAIEDIDLTGISTGGGSGEENIDWQTIPRNTLRAPAVQLNMPIVSKGKKLISSRQEGNSTINDYAIDVPVSFQCGWLNTSAPLTGKAGTSVLTGHVNYPNGNFAPMSAIKLLGTSDIVLTTDDAGIMSRWSVTKTYKVNQSEFSTITGSTDKDGARRLLLVTCELDENGVYSKNYAVEAVSA